MKSRPQFRWSIPAVAAGPVYGPVSAISAFEHDGFSADADAGDADPPTVATIAAAPATTATPRTSPIRFLIPLLLVVRLSNVTAFAAHLFLLIRDRRAPGW